MTEQDAQDIAGMEMPCQCVCGMFFDLNDGNPCDGCNGVFCQECVEEPFGFCEMCREIRND